MGNISWNSPVKVSSGVFTVTVENPRYVDLDNTARLQARFEHVNDGLVDPSSPTLKIYDSSVTLKDTITPTKDAQGEYYTDYSFVSATYGTGPYMVEWSGTYGGKSILARSMINVRRIAE
ncbi:MAG: hypothetical protein M1503_10170 [Thaumarchaeota archaeon]|nr:hypothetical protein [Nitrososphaerota archaeon]MCL5318607.1 hypothetical protein [Nitrososphaerota archaeon]